MAEVKKKRQLKFLFVLAGLAAVLVILFTIFNSNIMQQKYKKVLVIGIDGMDPKIISRLIDDGKTPNFEKLSQSGVMTELATSNPPHSPVAWTSIATGTNPGKHNIFDFIRRDPSSYLPMLSLTKSAGGMSGYNYESFVKSDPFWRITSGAGIPTTVIRWPVTFPAEKVKGNLLSGLGVPDVKGLLSGYSFYTSREIEPGKTSNKIIQVESDGGVIETEVFGPKVKKGSDIVEVKVPMKIELSGDSATLSVQGASYQVKAGDWSDWVRAEFKTGLFKSVYGIFKAHLVSVDPFEMYITTMQIDPANPVADISSPSSYSKELAEEIGLYFTLGMPEETDGFVDGKIDATAFLKNIAEIEDERDKMFWKEFENFKNSEGGILAFVYDSSDRVNHVFWDTKLLEGSGELVINPAISDYLAEKDAFVGKVLSELDSETLLLVLSDHGFTSFERAVSMNAWLLKNGFLTLTQELPKGDEGELFKYVDWSKTQAYSLGFNSIYVNLKGREGKGIVEDKESVISSIIEKLEALTDEKSGKKAINKVYRQEEIYNGDFTDNAPDLVIGYNPGFRMAWQTAIGGFTEEVFLDNTKVWRGDHLIDPKFVPGLLLSNTQLKGGSASQMDIAPTVLDALGVEIPKDMDGKSLLE